MRKILFRAVLIDHQVDAAGHPGWVYGELHLNSKIPHIHADGKSHPIDVGTIGEFTGLKDKNGMDIYEGDIVLFFGRPAVVEMRNGAWEAVRYGTGISYLLRISKCEIIGDKWHDKRLLEGGVIDEDLAQ